MDKVDFSKTVYVVEGPIDSLFLENYVAVAQSDLRLPHKSSGVVQFSVVSISLKRSSHICLQGRYPFYQWQVPSCMPHGRQLFQQKNYC